MESENDERQELAAEKTMAWLCVSKGKVREWCKDDWATTYVYFESEGRCGNLLSKMTISIFERIEACK